MIDLSPLDIGVIALFAVAVMSIGFLAGRRTRSTTEDFLLGGRRLTLPIFVMTLVSTWYGGVLGMGEFTYSYGISNWFTQGVPYYVFAAAFALFLAKKIRAAEVVSIPDVLDGAYGRKAGVLGGVLMFVLTSPAPYLLEIGVLLQLLFGWSMGISLLVTAVVGVSYLFTGGFRSDVQTDVVEFFLMFAGFFVIIPFCILQFGGLDFLQTHLPPLHLTPGGGNSLSFILVWFFIALWTFVDPAFHQRCAAAKDGQTARRGIVLSIFFWFCFDAMTVTAGLYARAAMPDLAEPLHAFPLLAELTLPPVFKGMFFVGLFATILSTLNSFAFLSAQTLGRDIVARLTGRMDRSALYTRAGLIVAFVIAALSAWFLPSVIGLWYTIGTVTIPGLLIPVLTAYSSSYRMSPAAAFIAMLLGWITSLCWMLAGHDWVYPLGIEPMYPGIAVTVVMWLLDVCVRRNRRFVVAA